MSKKTKVAYEHRDKFDNDTKQQIVEKNKLKAKTAGQQYFLDTIEDCQITLCSGPSGSGKSFLALAKGLEYLKDGKYDQIVLFRPVQECGRQIGHLPGDKDEKLAPHVNNFMEIFGKLISRDVVTVLLKEGKIRTEVIEFTRGMTFDNSYIVVDEAQNCTYQQLCMLVTRIADSSKIVFTGDTKQFDLYEKYVVDNKCPYDTFIDKLDDIDDSIGYCELTYKDIVRSKILAKICMALGL